jgi:NAD(P)-dependent dehydrogenase (short-subunit alcohol dehydrogenase family)
MRRCRQCGPSLELVIYRRSYFPVVVGKVTTLERCITVPDMSEADRVAWVTGGSRGVGAGVAVALGRAGWHVYVTARSSGSARTSHLPGTVEEIADQVTQTGGIGVAVACDHRDDQAVSAVADRIGAEHGRLDLLVNNVWAGYERLNAGAWPEWTAPMWEQPVELFDAMFGGGVRAHYVALARCAPLLMASARGLVVTVSFALPPAEQASYGVAYGMAKSADDRLALAAALQLREHGVASVALHPGLVRTEGVMQFAEHMDLSGSQSPEGVGRAVAALASDPEVMAMTGQAISVSELAEMYGLDVSG